MQLSEKSYQFLIVSRKNQCKIVDNILLKRNKDIKTRITGLKELQEV
jgi:hypothetical protein